MPNHNNIVVFLLWAISVMLRELNFEILEQMISTKNIPALNQVGFFLVWLSAFKFKDRLLNASFLFNNCAIECFHNAFFMAFVIVPFSYSTAVSYNLTKISSWNYIIKLRKVKLLNTTQLISDNLILSVHTSVL